MIQTKYIYGAVGFVLGGLIVRFAVEESLNRKYKEKGDLLSRVYLDLMNDLDASEKQDEVASTVTENGISYLVDDYVEVVKARYEEIAETYLPEPAHTDLTAVTKLHDELEVSTPVERFLDEVASTVSENGISYIEEEEFMEDDGRSKERVDFMIDTNLPYFFIDGVQVDNWTELLGGSLLADFWTLTPPGDGAVFYVRNHLNNTDYEVIQVVLE